MSSGTFGERPPPSCAIFMNGFTRRKRGEAVTGKAPSPGLPSVAAAPWFLWPESQAVFACLNQEGFEVRAVGGAVRNALTGRAVTEVDFATTAKPDDIIRLAARAGIETKPIGIAHGTITLIAGKHPFE